MIRFLIFDGDLTKIFGDVCIMKQIVIVISVVLLFFARVACAYDPYSAVGFWLAIDDKTNKPSSLIKIWQDPKNLNYYGKIYKILGTEGRQDKKRPNPMLGRVIITDMKYQNKQYVNGWVFDPRSGTKYHAKMWVTQDGRLLNLRGYVGVPLLGRTTQWQRMNK